MSWHRLLQASQAHWKDAKTVSDKHFYPLYLLGGARRQITFQQVPSRNLEREESTSALSCAAGRPFWEDDHEDDEKRVD